MSITNNRPVRCECGITLDIFVADSINASRHPDLRQSLLGETLHRFNCHACGRALIVETRFTYLDLERRQLLFVVPHDALAQEPDAIAEVCEAYEISFGARAAGAIRELGRGMMVRLCFGLRAAREKIIADEAGINDLFLEEAKCIVLATQPALFGLHVRALWLDRIEEGSLILFAESDAIDRRRIIHVPRALYESLAREGAERILARRPQLVSGPHVSAMRLGLA